MSIQFHQRFILIKFFIIICEFLRFLKSNREKIEGIGNQLCLETDDVEAAISMAVTAGAVVEGEITEGGGACCGGRVGKVKDPFGYVWLICSPSNKCPTVEA